MVRLFPLYVEALIHWPISLSELVKDGQNGLVFKDAQGLSDHLEVCDPRILNT